MTKLDLLNAFGLGELATLAEKAEVKAGVLEGATNHENGESVAMYAAMNEFGTSDIPSRPFLRRTVDEKADNWMEGLGRMLGNGRAPSEALRLLGTRMADDIVATIASNMPPRNSPRTIERKRKKVLGGVKGETHAPGTLVDTGSLINSINYEVTL